MNLPRWFLLFFCIICFTFSATAQPKTNASLQPAKDSVVIPFDYKQSALYQLYTMQVIDSVIKILLKNDSVTLSIDGYAHKDEGNDTITKYLSLNRALFIETYVLGRGIDSSRIVSVIAYGKTKQIYRGTINMGIGNCRAVIKLNYPLPAKPVHDRDGDNISDSLDTCPDEYGDRARHGCPDTTAIIIPFENMESSLHSLTYKVMDSVVKVLRENPTYTITILGHAYKTEGTPIFCENISTERSYMVKQYLMSRYIAVSRIESIEGVGTVHPITAGRNHQEIVRNCRAEIYLNRH